MLRVVPKILMIILILNCEGVKSKKTNGASLVLLLLQGGASCAVSSTTAISNPGVLSPSRVNYDISGCSQNTLSSIGLSGQNVSVGLTGTNTSSAIVSTGSVLSANDVSIEVSFTLNSPNAYLDIFGRASGTPSSLAGPKVRLTNSTIQAGGTSGILSNLGNGILLTTVGQPKTYCIDIHQEESAHFIFYPSSCATIASKESPYNYDATVETAFPGRGVGFVLNGVTITNFKVGTKVFSGGKIVEK